MRLLKKLSYLPAAAIIILSCKSNTKQQEDEVYSRHLQQHVKLSVITTPMPDNKEDMNLLLFNAGGLLETLRAKNIIDSLYKKKLIQPLTLVAFDGKEENYRVTGKDAADIKEMTQFNDFVSNELYPFIKKKISIRKFHSVVICGFSSSATSTFNMIWQNDEKISKAGLFYPVVENEYLAAIAGSRKRPQLDIWINTNTGDSNTIKLKDFAATRTKVKVEDIVFAEPVIAGGKKIPTTENFVRFLLWAFKR